MAAKVSQSETPVSVMRAPRTVEVEITSRCNLRCRYCSFFDNPDRQYVDVPAAAWLKFFEELGKNGVMKITMSGGEAFTRGDLSDLVTGIVKNRMRFSILSNGGLIDDERARHIAATGRCDYIQISVDGARAEDHDVLRGKGAFAGALRGIAVLQRHHIAVQPRVTIHHHNVHALENIARFLLEELQVKQFSTNAAGYMGACCHNAEEVLLTIEDRYLAMETLSRLGQKYPGRITALAGPLVEARQWQKMEKARLEKAPPFPRGGRLTGCGCSFSMICVRADGVYVPCNLLPHIELGRIGEDDLLEVWHSPQLDRLRGRQTIGLDACEFCRGCPYIPYCTGNCPAGAYTRFQDIDQPNPDDCLRRYLGAGGMLPADGCRKEGDDAP